MRRSRSLVPQKLQVPLTIVMACVFVVVLYWRLGGTKTSKAIPAPPAPPSQQVDMLAAELVEQARLLRAGLQTPAAGPASEPGAVPSRNPFFPADFFAAQEVEVSEPVDILEVEQQAQPQAPAEILPPLPRLSAVMLHENGNLAKLDGEYVREGEMIGGFRVLQILERRVQVADGERREWVELNTGLRMKGGMP